MTTMAAQLETLAPLREHRPVAVGISTRQLGITLAVVAWAALALMWATGSARVFGHDQTGVSAIPSIGLFLVGWTVMVAAMMLPSSVPTLRRVDHETGSEPRAASSRFMGGYFLAWAAFGAASFAGDGVLHMAVDRMPWLAQRSWLIAAGAAMFAGLAEMLGRTRPPVLPLGSRDGGAFAVGKAHAIDRIRRCWPLMLFAMAVGMGNPGWMVGLTLVMALELRPHASAALRLIGLVLFAVGAAVVIEPGWTPVLLGGA